MYIFNKNTQQTQRLNEEVVIFEEKDYDKVVTDNYEDLSNGYGYITANDDNKPEYKEYFDWIAVNKDKYYWTEGNVENDDNFYSVYLSVKTIKEMGKLRVSSPAIQIMYFDDEFHIFEIDNGYTFDYKNKKVVRDDAALINQMMYSLNNVNIDYLVRYNGFPLIIGDKTYLQPFRNVEDLIYFQTMKNDFLPEERILKLYNIAEDGSRDKTFDTIKGISISDDLLTGIIKKIILYGNELKVQIEYFLNEINKFREDNDIEKVTYYHENVYKIIIDRLIKELEG